MTIPARYTPSNLQRESVDGLKGLVVLQFGTNWCGHCQNARAVIEPVIAARPDVQRYLIEDGPGRPLGRSYRIKLWPTLVLLYNGQELGRVVRPQQADELGDLLAKAQP